MRSEYFIFMMNKHFWTELSSALNQVLLPLTPQIQLGGLLTILNFNFWTPVENLVPLLDFSSLKKLLLKFLKNYFFP
jgi:hypothetical protein